MSQSLTTTDAPNGRAARLVAFLRKESTFFRLHLLAFTIIPLISSGVFYACNGRFRVSYIDSLFLCYSSMTVTGLSTVNLSTLTAWQQVMLYILMMIGDITMVSWIMVLVRKEYFVNHCEYAAANSKRISKDSISPPIAAFKNADTIMGSENPPGLALISPTPGATLLDNEYGIDRGINEKNNPDPDHILSDSDARTFTSSPKAQSVQLSPMTPIQSRTSHDRPPLGMTTSFAPSTYQYNHRRTTHRPYPPPQRTLTRMTSRSNAGNNDISPTDRKYHGLGGFPGPLELLNRLFKRASPAAYRKLERKMTMPYTRTVEAAKTSWLNFDLLIGRNSDFRTDTLSDEQLEEIGGAEYQALRWLSYLVPAYFVGTQLLSYLLFAPWISVTHEYDSVFEAQPRIVKKPWFALFQVMGAYTGGGLSLVDLGMVPFQKAYLMIFAVIFTILAGNHALPIFLRFVIWIGSKLSTHDSDTHKAFTFLLDHPRRCFVYLFPSHQTWFLVICLIGFSVVEWISFEVLNIGLEAYESLSIGPRIVSGLFQGLAARASGFSIVPIASLAPALQFLYVVMMYIAVYPVALSIRSTNVYEERSLGVFEEPPDEEDEEPADLNTLEPRQRIGRYVGWHLRRQISIDIWWLVWGVFLVAIIERNNLLDQDKKWFDLFRVLFELVSAFGGIGLTLGLPSDNFSFSGAMSPLSKLVIIVIMVRGRHRGLPVAVDRAVLLPSELVLEKSKDQPQQDPKSAEPNGQHLEVPNGTNALP